jgi:hypothetical protein
MHDVHRNAANQIINHGSPWPWLTCTSIAVLLVASGMVPAGGPLKHLDSLVRYCTHAKAGNFKSSASLHAPLPRLLSRCCCPRLTEALARVASILRARPCAEILSVIAASLVFIVLFAASCALMRLRSSPERGARRSRTQKGVGREK